MSVTWSEPPGSARHMLLAELGSLGENLGMDNGESRRVCHVPRFPGWLFKEYRKPLDASRAEQLGRLIHVPSQMKTADLRLVDRHTAWPATQVIGPGGDTVGVLMPLAPASFKYQWAIRPGRVKDTILDVDLLGLTEADQRDRNLPPQSLADRVAVCASLVSVGALFERHGLVYLDWSWANVFWSPSTHDAFVIDMDGCSIGPRKQIQSPNWDDPLVPMGEDAGNLSDRFRLALLTARLLTGTRNGQDTEAGLRELRANSDVRPVVRLLEQAINATDAKQRPTLVNLSVALKEVRLASANGSASSASSGRMTVGFNGSGKGGVSKWKDLPGTSAAGPVKTTPVPKPAPASPRSPMASASPGRPTASVTSAFSSAMPTAGMPAFTPASSQASARTATRQRYTPASPTSMTSTAPAKSGGLGGAIAFLLISVIILSVVLYLVA